MKVSIKELIETAKVFKKPIVFQAFSPVALEEHIFTVEKAGRTFQLIGPDNNSQTLTADKLTAALSHLSDITILDALPNERTIYTERCRSHFVDLVITAMEGILASSSRGKYISVETLDAIEQKLKLAGRLTSKGRQVR